MKTDIPPFLRLDLVTRLEPPHIPRRPTRARWWLATLLMDWTHALTCWDTGDEPAWLQEFAIAYVRWASPSRGEGAAFDC